MRLFKGIRGFTALLLMAALSACSGGGTSQQAVTTTSTNNVVINAASPDDVTPAAQTFTVTISPGTVYLTILHNGASIDSVSNTPPSGTTATITVTPAAPASLGAGIFKSTITITGYVCADPACTKLASGNTQVVNVTYQIPPIVTFVAPYVVTAGVPGTVTIRGRGFQQFAVTGVSFGSTPATAYTVVSDTLIQASYPNSLAVGIYPVTIQAPTSPATITSLANLVVASPPNYAATTIAYPSAVSQVKELVYDAQRQALLVAVDTSGGEVLRYPYSGGWGAATSATINTLSDIALSADGKQLLALSQTALTPLDPVTLAPGTATQAPVFATAGTYFKNLAVGNDNNAVISTGFAGGTYTGLYVYIGCDSLSLSNVTCTPAFSQPSTTPTLDNATAVASTDGSLIAIMQGDPTQTSPPNVYQYAASSDTFGASSVLLNQNSVAPAVSVYTPVNSTTSTVRLVLSGTDVNNNSVINVYDGGYNLFGTLPGTTLAVALYQTATYVYAYTYDSASSQVLRYDLTTSLGGGAYAPDASAPAANPGTGVRMTISPDGGTLFLAGSSQIVVQPVP